LLNCEDNLMASAGSDKQVCIVGIGARTPVGLTAASSSAAVRAAISAIGEHPFYIDKAGEQMCVARDANLPPELGGVERFYELAKPAMEEALLPLTRTDTQMSLPLFLGLPELRPGLPNNLDQVLALRLDQMMDTAKLHVITRTFSYGHSAGLIAMEEASRQIRQGQIEVCLVGGVDSYMEAETLEWLDNEGQLMSGENRSGFPPGEGSGFCLLASKEVARRNRLVVLADVIGVATTIEKNRIKTETICIGEGLSSVFSALTSKLKLPGEKINAIYCDMNGERYRTEEFVFTALRHQAAFVDVHDTTHPADCWGDIGAASGPLFTCLAVASSQRGYARGPRSLMWTSSEGGQRSAALLHLPMVSGRN
jgi:3-oxoacyl-[acyl-carrier-protein] synthase-1